MRLIKSAVVAALLVVLTSACTSSKPPPRQPNPVTITGSVHCTSGEPVAGIWIAAARKEDSGKPTTTAGSDPSTLGFAYMLPYGGTYSVHMGCGDHGWEHLNESAPIQPGTSQHFDCTNTNKHWGHGRCTPRP